MSKAAAIHTAICTQLASDGKVIPELKGYLGKVGTTAGQYDDNTIRGFWPTWHLDCVLTLRL